MKGNKLMTKDEMKEAFKNYLNELLDAARESCDFQIDDFDPEHGCVTVTFPLVVVDEDEYAGFNAY